jgi:amidase
VVGGSSGGKGGLLALRGSVLGLGTDIGSSVRTPAGWNGCFGLRPSTGRYPYQGIASTIDGQLTVPFVVGPMATSAKALTLMTTTILSLQPWKRDPLVHELPWKDAQFTEVARRFNGLGEKLAFGIMFTDGYCESTASHKSNSYST